MKQVTFTLVTLFAFTASVSAQQVEHSECGRGCVLAAFKKGKLLNVPDVCSEENFGLAFTDCVNGSKCPDAAALSSNWKKTCEEGKVATGLTPAKMTADTPNGGNGNTNGSANANTPSGDTNLSDIPVGDEASEQNKDTSAASSVSTNTLATIALTAAFVFANL